MTDEKWNVRRLQGYARGLASGLLTAPEVASATLAVLAEVADRRAVWAAAPAALRESVLAHLAGVGLDGLPRPFRFGPMDSAWRVAQAEREREVAAELLGQAEPVAGADPARRSGCVSPSPSGGPGSSA